MILIQDRHKGRLARNPDAPTPRRPTPRRPDALVATPMHSAFDYICRQLPASPLLRFAANCRHRRFSVLPPIAGILASPFCRQLPASPLLRFVANCRHHRFSVLPPIAGIIAYPFCRQLSASSLLRFPNFNFSEGKSN